MGQCCMMHHNPPCQPCCISCSQIPAAVGLAQLLPLCWLLLKMSVSQQILMREVSLLLVLLLVLL